MSKKFERSFTLESLESADCRDVMEIAQGSLDGKCNCAEALQRMIERRTRCVPVLTSGRLDGLVTIGDFARLKDENPMDVGVEAIMTPAPEIVSVAPETSAFEAFAALRESGYHQLPVLGANGKFEGFITREIMMNALATDRD